MVFQLVFDLDHRATLPEILHGGIQHGQRWRRQRRGVAELREEGVLAVGCPGQLPQDFRLGAGFRRQPPPLSKGASLPTAKRMEMISPLSSRMRHCRRVVVLILEDLAPRGQV